MKTYNKLTQTEKNILFKKTTLSYNLDILHNMSKYVYTKISDPAVLDIINELLENFLDNLNSTISKHLSTNETDNEKNTCSSSD